MKERTDALNPKALGTAERGSVVPMGYDSHCGAIKAVYSVKDALLYVHGSVGCTFYQRCLFSMHDNFYIKMLSSGLEQKHVIFGGEQVLEEGLEKAIQVFQPELIVVQNTCIPILIGDDAEGVVKRLKEKRGIKILSSNNPNYRGNQVSGFQNVLKDYVTQLMERQGPPRERSVNLLGVMPGEYNWRADLREAKRLLRGIGLSVNATLIGYDTTVREIVQAPQAEANVFLYPEVGLPTAELMKERFGTPYLETAFPPLGISSTREWLLRIAAHFGLTGQAEALLEEEMTQMGEALSELDTGQFFPLQFLFGKNYALKANPFQIPAMVRFLYEDLSLCPTTIAFKEVDEQSLARLEKVLQENDLSPEVQTSGDHLQFFEAITRNHHYPFGDPWIVIGSTLDALELAWAGQRLPVIRFTFPVIDEALIIDHPFVGLRGVVFLIQQLYNELIKKVWETEDAVGTFSDLFTNVQRALEPFMVD